MSNQKNEAFVTDILKNLGIPANIKGYHYMRYILLKQMDDPSFLLGGITKLVYPDCAKHFNSTPSRVERCCRHAIEQMFLYGDAHAIHQIFGNAVNPHKGKCTNSAWFFGVSDYIHVNAK